MVIGGGVIGVCAAYYLLQAGRQVTILERDAVCSGSSWGNSGLIVPSHSIPLPVPGVVIRGLKWMLNPESPFYIKPRFDLKLISWLWQFRAASTHQRMRQAVPVLLDLSQASISLYDELIEQEKLECGYERSGLFMLYKTHRGYDEGREEARLLGKHGLHGREMTGTEVHDMEPAVRPDIAGGIYFDGDAHLNPAEFVQALALQVKEKGGAIHEGAEVLGFESSSGRITTVRTSRGEYHPEQVVLAAGSWSPGLVSDLRLNLPVQPAKGYSITFQRPQKSLTFPLILGEAKVGINPMGPVLRFAGTLELSGIDLTINSRRVKAIVRSAGDYLIGGEEPFSADDTWAGLRPSTPDGLPIIGRANGLSNLIVATGHATVGVTLGPITGKLVTQIACNQTPAIDLTALSPERFQ